MQEWAGLGGVRCVTGVQHLTKSSKGVWARGRGEGAAAPQTLSNLDFLNSKRNLTKACLKSLHEWVCAVLFFFRREILSILNWSQRGKASYIHTKQWLPCTWWVSGQFQADHSDSDVHVHVHLQLRYCWTLYCTLYHAIGNTVNQNAGKPFYIGQYPTQPFHRSLQFNFIIPNLPIVCWDSRRFLSTVVCTSNQMISSAIWNK